MIEANDAMDLKPSNCPPLLHTLQPVSPPRLLRIDNRHGVRSMIERAGGRATSSETLAPSFFSTSFKPRAAAASRRASGESGSRQISFVRVSLAEGVSIVLDAREQEKLPQQSALQRASRRVDGGRRSPDQEKQGLRCSGARGGSMCVAGASQAAQRQRAGAESESRQAEERRRERLRQCSLAGKERATEARARRSASLVSMNLEIRRRPALVSCVLLASVAAGDIYVRNVATLVTALDRKRWLCSSYAVRLL